MSFFQQILHRIKSFISESRWNFFFSVLLIFFNIFYLIIAIFFNPIYDDTDGFIYYLYFNDLLKKRIPPTYSNFWPPGIPVLIGLTSFLFGDYFIAGKILMVEFSILFLFMCYILIKKVFNEYVAFFSFLFLAADQDMMMYYVQTINIDIPFASLILISLFFLIRNRGKHNLIYSSIFLSLATLIKLTGFFFIPIIIFKIIFSEINNRENQLYLSKLKRIIINLSKYLVIFIIILIPYFIINILWYGNPIYNDNIRNVYASIAYYFDYEIPNEYSWIELFLNQETAPLFYMTWFYTIFIHVPIKFLYLLIYYKIPFIPLVSLLFKQQIPLTIISIFVFWLAFVGFYVHFKKEKKSDSYNEKFLLSNNFFVLLIIAIYLVFISMSVIQTRFLFPIVIFLVASLIYLLMIIISSISKAIKRLIISIRYRDYNNPINEKIKNQGSIYIFIMLILFQFVVASYAMRAKYQEEFIEYKIVGDFLKNRTIPDDKIAMVRKNYIYYIGECNYVDYPFPTNKTEFFISLRDTNVKYLIISERNDISYSPELSFLLNPLDEDIPDFVEIIFIYNISNIKILIYQLHDLKASHRFLKL